MSITRSLAAIALVAATTVALTSAAEARHRRIVVRAAPGGPILVPAHERPGFVHATGIGIIDLGLGPVFPFGGWPKQL